MSEESAPAEPVALTRRTYAALNGRDFDTVLGMFDPVAVWDVSRWGLGTHAGLKAIRHFLEDWFGSLERYDVRIEEIHDLGNGVIWLVVLQIAHTAGSRSLIRARSAPVFVWAECRIKRVTVYPDIDEARAAAEDLAEQGGHVDV